MGVSPAVDGEDDRGRGGGATDLQVLIHSILTLEKQVILSFGMISGYIGVNKYVLLLLTSTAWPSYTFGQATRSGYKFCEKFLWDLYE